MRNRVIADSLPSLIIFIVATACDVSAQTPFRYDGTNFQGPTVTMHGLAAYDLDRNGRPVIVGSDDSGGVVTYRFDESGFGRSTTVVPGLQVGQYRVVGGAPAVADVDGDGWLDCLVPTISLLGGSGAQNLILMNDRAGGWIADQSGRLPPLLDTTGCVVLFDADGDGDQDIFFGNAGEPNRLLLNDGRGYFADVSSTHLPGNVLSNTAVAAVDVDGDGDIDLVIANAYAPAGYAAYLLINDGAGRFVAGQRLLSGWSSGYGVAIGDIDRDGDSDIVVLMGGRLPMVWLNDGAGLFVDRSVLLPGPGPGGGGSGTRAINLVDVDGDGWLDIVTPAGPMMIYQNQGGTGFVDRSLDWRPTNEPGAVSGPAVFADFDLDGDVDMIARFSNFIGPRGIAFFPSLRRQIHVPAEVTPGTSLTITLNADAQHLAQAFLSLGATFVPLPGLGVLGLDPSSLTPLPPVAIGATRAATIALPIPANPTLIGASVWFQAIEVGGSPVPSAHMTSWLRTKIRWP